MTKKILEGKEEKGVWAARSSEVLVGRTVLVESRLRGTIG